jgi:hypothetical protein
VIFSRVKYTNIAKTMCAESGGLKMTIDEAISHALEVAEGQDKCAEISVSKHAKERISKCASDHRQLAEWLKELKEAKKFIRKLQNELLKGTSFYSTSFYEENKELMDKLTEGVEYLDD